jgi:glycosyltransferase involved in cell wall biosynthesis
MMPIEGKRVEVISGQPPRVSVGMPVYNGEHFLAGAIESILSQTRQDLELVISDNASTDGTERICREFASRDSRVRYYRADKNHGAAWNHNRVFELSRGEYFKWHTDDDLCDPTFIEKCVEVLDREPSVVLCYSQFVRITAQGNRIEGTTFGWRPTDSSPVSGVRETHKRFRALIYRRNACEEIYGVMRAAAARETRLIGGYTQSDDNFLAELVLRGVFHEIPELLFYYRLHTQKSTEAYRSRVERVAWFDPSAAHKLNIPFVRQFREYLALIHRAPLGFQDRVRCYRHAFGWAWSSRQSLKDDLYEAVFRNVLVPFLKRRAAWSRPMWHAIRKTLHHNDAPAPSTPTEHNGSEV